MEVKYYEDKDISHNKNSIFLAGPTPRTDDVQSWRGGALKILEELNFDGVVYVPENRNGKHVEALDITPIINWELERLEKASRIVFWVPRELKDMPAFTTNVEFGYHMKTGKVIYGRPENAPKTRYLDYLYFLNYEKKPFNSLQETLACAVESLALKKSQIFFTSDTHFGSKRHLELSKRPFKNVDEMDRGIIQNWNRQVNINDVVYHLGDFGNFDIIKSLNGKIILILGNYEKDELKEKFDNDFDAYKSFLKEKGFYDVVKDNLTLNILGEDVFLTHEPLNCDINKFNLFGHIHERQFVKRFGLNVGIDCKNFRLFDLDMIKFYKEGIEKFYDNNVFCNSDDLLKKTTK